MDYNKIIGSNIRFERQKRNLTIDELSEILEIAPGFLGLIERGQRGTSIKNLCKISEFFSISLDTLITLPIDGKKIVKEESSIEKKKSVIATYLNSMNEKELDFFISTMKGFRKYTASKNEDMISKIDE